MRIITFNANGIRAAARKGFFTWLAKQDADVVCIQETKAKEHQLKDLNCFPDNYYDFYFDADKPGYSGVAIYTKQEPDAIHKGLGWDTADTEGRYIQVDFGDLSIASLYLPSGTSSDERQTIKYDFLDRYKSILDTQGQENRSYIICGDFNIAHQNIDIKNWKNNQKNSGFLPEERAWLDTLFNDSPYIDVFRHLYPDKEQYTWWSNRAGSWDRNVGWRIDYHVVSESLASQIKECSVYRDEKFSDHAPMIVDYDLEVA